MITPQAHITQNGIVEYEYENTYVKLKKRMLSIIKRADDGIAHVYRSRRGEWGEWYEHWEIDNGKATITKQGWS